MILQGRSNPRAHVPQGGSLVVSRAHRHRRKPTSVEGPEAAPQADGTGGKHPRRLVTSETGGCRPERGEAQGSHARVRRIKPALGTDCLRGQNPGAAADACGRSQSECSGCVESRDRLTDIYFGEGRTENGRWARTGGNAPTPAGRSKTAKG